MNRFVCLIAFVLWIAALAQPAQQKTIGLPVMIPTVCVAGEVCHVSYTWPGTTGIVIARLTPSGRITDSLGSVWTKDLCSTYTHDCIFHTYFTNPDHPGDVIYFSPGEGTNAIFLEYEGRWDYTGGNVGDYANQNSVFDDCVNGQDCPYNWTLPIDADAGQLLIAYSDSLGVPKAGPGFQFEAISTSPQSQLIAEDMITPAEGVYMGSLVIKGDNGSSTGGTHWLMVLAGYKRTQ